MSDKVLIHISDRNRWRHVLSQAAGLKDGAKGVRVVILADGFAGAFCASCGPDLIEKLDEAVSRGVDILVCEESLALLNIKKEKLPAALKTVPAAYLAILKMAKEGFIYISAG